MQFFLKGTQLSQLSEEYQTCMDNVQRMHNIIGAKRGVIEDLRTAYEEAASRFTEASKARDLRHKVDSLKKELAWAHVAAKGTVRRFLSSLHVSSLMKAIAER